VGAMAVQHPQQPAAQSSTLLQMLPGTQQQQAGAATQHQQPPSNTTRRQRKPRQQKPQLQPPASVSRPLLAASQQQAGVQQHALWRVMRERAEAAAAAVTATAGAEGQAAAVDEDDTLQHDRSGTIAGHCVIASGQHQHHSIQELAGVTLVPRFDACYSTICACFSLPLPSRATGTTSATSEKHSMLWHCLERLRLLCLAACSSVIELVPHGQP
jgi:hypothetical protein